MKKQLESIEKKEYETVEIWQDEDTFNDRYLNPGFTKGYLVVMLIAIPLISILCIIYFIFGEQYLLFLIAPIFVFELYILPSIENYRACCEQQRCDSDGVLYYGPKAKLSASPLVYRFPERLGKELRKKMIKSVIYLLSAVVMLIFSLCITEHPADENILQTKNMNIFFSSLFILF
jgi:hypothetical protein